MAGSWDAILEAARAEKARFAAALRSPRQTQLGLLDQIIRKNRDTDFGRRNGFSSISDLASFRRRVPVRSYEDFRCDIDRIALGEADVLTADRIIAFEETGGSETGGKLIPYTEASLAGFRRAVLPWLAGLAQRWPEVTSGPTYVTLSPATRPSRQAPCGIPIGLEGDAAYLGAELVPAFAALLAVPPSVAKISEVDRWQIETLVALVEAEDLTFISLWSPTFLVALLGTLPGHADRISASLTASARGRLEQALRGPEIDTQHLWPRLACVSCWTDGPSAGFAAQLAGLFPHAAIDPKGLLATEAAITVPVGTNGLAVPALTSCVIEFIDATGEAGLCDELADGEDYRIVLTTEGGLYRYAIGDVVRCVGHDRDVPRLQFLGRAERSSDLVGEKLTEAFVSEILADLRIAGCVAASDEPAGYVLHIDTVGDSSSLTRKVEQRLCGNPQYAHALRMGQLAPLRVEAGADVAADGIAKGIASGRRMGDVKPLALIPLTGVE